MCTKNDLYAYTLVTSELDPLTQILNLLSSCSCPGHFSTKLEVSTAFLVRENRRHAGRTDRRMDGVQRLMRRLRGPHNISSSVEARCVSAILEIKMSFASKKYAGKTGPGQWICTDKFLKQRKAIKHMNE